MGAITHTFPDVQALSADPHPTLAALARALADGTLDLGPGADRAHAARQLAELPGLDPTTITRIRMRALADPDVLIVDRALRDGLRGLGPADDRQDIAARAEHWRPWRSYATHHLWALADGPPEDASPQAGRLRVGRTRPDRTQPTGCGS
ncbi:hypothetical protein [Embleya sp. AB8]|uniref:hypothetical protein n=1 Tax=Embleya sp. AB8 TaxID=3156304 RepID=UPI003C7896EB